MQQSTASILTIFDNIFNAKTTEELARRSGFIQRSSSSISGSDFIRLFAIPCKGVAKDSLNGLCLRLRKISCDIDISASALCQRINTEAAENMMKSAFGMILRLCQERFTRKQPWLWPALRQFHRVLLQDSTVCQLNEQLSGFYRGTNRGGRGACKSQIKVDLVHDLSTGVIVDAHLAEGNLPDQGLSERILQYIKPNDLIVRDLGYFSLPTIQSIAERQAYFLTRFPAHVSVYLEPTDKEPICLQTYLGRLLYRSKRVDIEVYVGAQKLKTRMVVFRVPKGVRRQRLRAAEKRAKAVNRKLSPAKEQSLGYSAYLTNASKEQLAAEIINEVYRLRWEIELIFKTWKSLLKIDYLKGINIHRIRCLLWGRLCMALLMAMVSAAFSVIATDRYGVELSSTKLICYLMREGCLLYAVNTHSLERLCEELLAIMPRRLLKDKRRRCTMRQHVIHLQNQV